MTCGSCSDGGDTPGWQLRVTIDYSLRSAFHVLQDNGKEVRTTWSLGPCSVSRHSQTPGVSGTWLGVQLRVQLVRATRCQSQRSEVVAEGIPARWLVAEASKRCFELAKIRDSWVGAGIAPFRRHVGRGPAYTDGPEDILRALLFRIELFGGMLWPPVVYRARRARRTCRACRA